MILVEGSWLSAILKALKVQRSNIGLDTEPLDKLSTTCIKDKIELQVLKRNPLIQESNRKNNRGNCSIPNLAVT